MVRKTLKAITTKISGLREAAFWLSLFALFSQILALFRDRLLAYHFGAGPALDIYYTAFKIPDLLFVTVASLVSISALIPLFAKKESEDPMHLRSASESIFTIFSVLIVFFGIVSWFLMPFLIHLFFSGLSLIVQEETIFLSRILLLSPLFLGFSNFFGSIVQYEKRFILYSLSPLLYNFGIIFGIVFLTRDFGIRGPVIGVIFGAFLHFALQAIFVFYSTMRPKFTFKIQWDVIWETARLSIPRTLALSIVSFVSFFFVAIAAKFSSGSIAIFNLSLNLQSIPLSLIGVSFSLAAFPSLAISSAKKNMAEIIERISSGLGQIVFWSLPITALFIVLRAHIVRVVLGSGSFDWSATRLVAASLALFILSAVFQSTQLFLSRSHYALGKTKWPLIGNIGGGLVSVLTAILFMNYFDKFKFIFDFLAVMLKVSDLPGDVLILPLAYSIGSFLTALILFLALGRDLVSEVWREIKTVCIHSILSAFVGGVFTYFTLTFLDGFFNLNTFWGVLGHGLIAGIVGILAFIASLIFLKNKEISSLLPKVTP